jgi:hypothetical protein
MTAKRNPRCFWRQMPSARSASQLPSAGDPSECTRFFLGLCNMLLMRHRLYPWKGKQHDDPDLVLNEHVTEDEVCMCCVEGFALCLWLWD